MAEKSLRIRTNVLDDSVVRVDLHQDVDFLEILSLKLNQKSHYVKHTSNYGIIVGRVLANDAFGVPNCKVSVFIPLSEEDKSDSRITSLYPYATVYDKNSNNVRYNLLPNDSDDECHRVIGTFPTKRYVLDNESIIEVFDKYYKYTTVTNNAGDYMICGVPANTSATVHVDIDFSDIGILSQSPRDMFEQGFTMESFDSSAQFKYSTNLDDLAQVQSQTKSVDVKPFWGDSSEVAINRCDIQINYKFEPKCIFLGSILTDGNDSKIGHKCTPSKGSGLNSKLIASEGTIEMIRKTVDGYVEEFPINANQLIDEDGVWCYQIPMNLDYIGTDEFGNIIRVENPNKGIPTRTSVRFRFTLSEEGASTKHRARYLVPNNPKIKENLEGEYVFPHIENGQSFNNIYEFGTATPDDCFRDLYWNKVYSVKNYIPRLQTARRDKTRQYSALKSTNLSEGVNQIPFNKIRTRIPFAYSIVCVLCKMIVGLIYFINRRLICFLDKLKIIKWYFFKIGCISFDLNISEDNETDVVFVPGCNCSRGQQLTECPEGQKTCTKVWDKGTILDTIQQTLSEEYDVANLDFYNDWLNGSLYFPLWFWKKTPTRRVLFIFKVKARSWFCSCARKFGKLKLVESCAVKFKYVGNSIYSKGLQYTGKDGDGKWHKSMSKQNTIYGFVNEFTNKDSLNIYYYACGMPNKEGYESDPNPVSYLRLYSTDIILLGSLNSCSMDGLPRLFDRLESSSANNPEIAAIRDAVSDEDTVSVNGNSEQVVSFDGDSENGQIEQSGMDWTNGGKGNGYQNGLFFDLGCNSVNTRIKTCANVGRLCELGVTYDQTYSIETSNNGVIEEDVYEADGMVTRHEIVDNESRAMFASMNVNGFLEKVTDENTTFGTYKLEYMYPVDLDGKLYSYSREYSKTRGHLTYDNFDVNYLKFRLGKTAHFYDNTFPLYENSFYFYFGMKEGSTAIDKFKSRYDAECFQNEKIPFSMEIVTESARFCPRPQSGDGKSDYALIEVYLSGIRKPYSYTLMDETGYELVHESNMYLDTLVFGAEAEEKEDGSVGYKKNADGTYAKDCYLWYSNPESYDKEKYDKESSYVKIDGNYISLENRNYIIKVTDAREKFIEKEVSIEPTYIAMDLSATGLGVKYHGYTSSGATQERSDYEYGYSEKLPSFAVDMATTDPNDNNDYDYVPDSETSGTTILTPQGETYDRELNISSPILNDSSVPTISENNKYGIDEKSYICGNGKAGQIVIDKIYIDGTPCEIVWIQDHYPTKDEDFGLVLYDLIGENEANETFVLDGFSSDLTPDTYVDGDFFCVVSDDSRMNVEGNMFKFVKLHIEPLRKDLSLKNCCCNYDDNSKEYDFGIVRPSGIDGDFWASFDNKEDDWLKYEDGAKPLSGGVWQHGDFDISSSREDPHVHFDIWVPGDYSVEVTEYCNNELSLNVSMDTVTIENGDEFIVNINDVPMQFLLGVAKNESDYNPEFFNPGAKNPGDIKGWFKVHLPNVYRFPSVSKDDFELWSSFVDPMYGENSDFTKRMKAEVLMYKFDSIFKMSKASYLTSEDLLTQFTSSKGGQKPILYMGAYPSYDYDSFLGGILVDTIGSTDTPDEWPNIVGSNYRYIVEGKTKNFSKKITIGASSNSAVEVSNAHLYNGLTTGYYGAKDPFFNPQLTNHEKDIVVGVTEGSEYLKYLGNYFAAFTLNGGKTNTDVNGKCRWSEDTSGKTVSVPMGASAYTLCAGQEQILVDDSNKLAYPIDIVRHYFRSENVDRRLDYDMFLYIPPSTKLLPNLMTHRDGQKYGEGSQLNSLWNKGRVYGTVYNGIEMSYDDTYNIIGNGLEYEYDIDTCKITSRQDVASTSGNRKFYRSHIKTDTLKNDIKELYYSGYHTPSGITSLKDFLNTEYDIDNDGIKCAPLNGIVTEKFSYVNEVNGDFSFNNYPTKRTINIFNIQPCNKLEFNVTSCSYDMESGLLGEGEYDIYNKKYYSENGVQEGTDDIAEKDDENDFTITARTQQGEECAFTIDTRDNCKPNSNNSDLDFVTSWDTLEVRYRSKALNLKYSYHDGSVDETTAKSYALCYFNDDKPYDLDLKFSIGQDIYCEDHDTYTSRPLIVNLLERPFKDKEEGTRWFYGDIGSDNMSVWCGNASGLTFENPMDLALSGTTPDNIMDNIRTMCRAQFMTAQDVQDGVVIQEDVARKPVSSKFDNSYVYQMNQNKYYFLTDSDNPDSDIVLDNTDEAERIRYQYGYYKGGKKNKEHYSQWLSNYSYYTQFGVFKYTKRRQYYQYRLASVIGVLYERNYVNTNNDNLGKNIKMLKLSQVVDLRPALVTLEDVDIVSTPSATTIPAVLYRIRWQEYQEYGQQSWSPKESGGRYNLLSIPDSLSANTLSSSGGTTEDGIINGSGISRHTCYSGWVTTEKCSDVNDNYGRYSLPYQANICGDADNLKRPQLEACLIVKYNGKNLLKTSDSKARALSLVYGVTPTYVKYFTSEGTSGGTNPGVIFPHGIEPNLARVATVDMTYSEALDRIIGFEADNKRYAMEWWNRNFADGDVDITSGMIQSICNEIAELSKDAIITRPYIEDEERASDSRQIDYVMTVSDDYQDVSEYINEKLRENKSEVVEGSGVYYSAVTVQTGQIWTNNRIRLYYTDIETSSITGGYGWNSGDPLWVSNETQNKFLQIEDYSINPEDGFTIVVTAPENSAWMTLYNGSGRTLDDCLVESASFDIENDSDFTSHRVTLLSADDMKKEGDGDGNRNFIGVKVEWKEDVVVDGDTHRMYVNKFKNNQVKCAVVLKMKNGLHYTLLLTFNQIGGTSSYFKNFD